MRSLKCSNFHSSCWWKSTLTTPTMMGKGIRQRRNAFVDGAWKLQQWHLILAAELTELRKTGTGRAENIPKSAKKYLCRRFWNLLFSPRRVEKHFQFCGQISLKTTGKKSRGGKYFSNFWTALDDKLFSVSLKWNLIRAFCNLISLSSRLLPHRSSNYELSRWNDWCG